MTWRGSVASVLLDGATLARKILDRDLAALLRGTRAQVVLDVGGAAGIRYRRLVTSEQYWTLDVQAKDRPSVVADAHHLPVRDASVNLVLCLQVLEHCVHPDAVVRELFRVLAPGGRLVLSTPLLYELHGSPHDYYRFTEGALRDLARQFETVKVHTMGNRFVAVYDLVAGRSVALNSVFGRLAHRFGTAPSRTCPCGFIVEAVKGR